MYRLFKRKITWIFPRYTARRRRDRLQFCLKCLMCVALALGIFILIAVPQRSMPRPTVTQRFVYSDRTKLELPFPVAAADVNNKTHVNGFPKIMHHIYENQKNVPMKPKWVEAHKSCLEKSPDFTHMMWNTTSVRSFLVKHYGWFITTFDAYKYPVQKFHVARYFILYHYGGIYIDMGIYCEEQLSSVMGSFPKGSSVVLRATHPSQDVPTSLLFARANSFFFNYVTQFLQGAKHESSFPYMSIMFSTGPRFLRNSYYAYEQNNQLKSESERTSMEKNNAIYILEHKFYKKLFRDINSSPWEEWDPKIILYLYQLIPSILTGLYG